MARQRYSVEQIVAVLQQAEQGMKVADLTRRIGISEQTFYRWKKQYAGLQSDQVRGAYAVPKSVGPRQTVLHVILRRAFSRARVFMNAMTPPLAAGGGGCVPPVGRQRSHVLHLEKKSRTSVWPSYVNSAKQLGHSLKMFFNGYATWINKDHDAAEHAKVERHM